MNILIGALAALVLIEGVVLAVFYKTIINLMDSNYLLLQRSMDAEKVIADFKANQEKARQILTEVLEKRGEQSNAQVNQIPTSDKLN